MARTTIIWTKTPESKRPSRKRIVKTLKEMFEHDYRDYDKAGDVDDAAYYAGRLDAVHDLLYSFGWMRDMKE